MAQVITIEDMIERVEKVDVTETIVEAMENTAQAYVRLQKLQMLLGENAKGKKIGRYKNASYASKKYGMNPLAGFGNVDLKLSGDFFKGIFLDPREDGFVVDSADSKTDDLIKKYSDSIFGLSEKNEDEYVDSYFEDEAGRLFEEKITG